MENGIIGFEQLRILCKIGTEPEERIVPQEIFVDLEVEANFASCIASENVADTINYVILADLCMQIAEEGHFQLLETYAAKVLEKVSLCYATKRQKIKIRKPKALANAQHAFVIMEKASCGS